jgi:hypothetical protein
LCVSLGLLDRGLLKGIRLKTKLEIYHSECLTGA